MNRQEYIENIKKLNYYTKLYDEGTPEISDEQWDALYFDCQLFEQETGYVAPSSPTSRVNYDVQNALKKVTHNHPMLSLDKTKDNNVLRAWIKEICLVMHKMDGLTCSLCYEGGKLISAETRGNGQVGEDITQNVMVLPSVPKTIPVAERFVVDGEIICKYDDFEEFSGEYKNPRNFAAGSIRLLDTREVARRHLTFVGWDLITSTQDLSDKLTTLKDYGFVVVEWEFVDLQNLVEQQMRMKALAGTKKYPIDGLVYKINNYQSYMAKGYNEHGFLGGFALKFYDELYETTLADIEWSVGRTGNITPVAVFQPVEIDGSTVKQASMHNITIMRKVLGENPRKGQKIWIFKANQIIPQVAKAEK